jgi:hypothetical protein
VDNHPLASHQAVGGHGRVTAPLVTSQLHCFLAPFLFEAWLRERLLLEEVGHINTKSLTIIAIEICQRMKEAVSITIHFCHAEEFHQRARLTG